MLRRCLVSGICVAVFSVFVTTGASAQRRLGNFAKPVPNAPFRGVVKEQRTFLHTNGTVINLKTMRVIARDSAGRIYLEKRQLVPASSTAAPLLLRAAILDPQTQVSTVLYPLRQRYVYRTFTVKPSPPSGRLDRSPTVANLPRSEFGKREDLGTKEMDGLKVHGMRRMHTLPASSGEKPVVITDEYWYSDYLHLNMVVKHSDPRTGSLSLTLTQVSKDEPDASLFTVPDGYKPLSMMRATRPR